MALRHDPIWALVGIGLANLAHHSAGLHYFIAINGVDKINSLYDLEEAS